MSKELTSEDVQNLISESENLRKLPTINILGLELDRQTSFVTLVSIIVWFLIWIFFGIFKIVHSGISILFLIIFIFISLLNLYNSATDVPDSSSEREKLSGQQYFIQGGLAVFILLLVFLYNIPMDVEYKNKIYKILLISLISTCVGTIVINVRNESENIRLVRKIQQAFYNQGIILFIFCLVLIYISFIPANKSEPKLESKSKPEPKLESKSKSKHELELESNYEPESEP